MTQAQLLLSEIYGQCPSAQERRNDLLVHMSQLDERKINCNSCPGHCCTYQYNSMQVDPLQALELYLYLESNNFFSEEFWEKMGDNIKEYRLDYEPYLGSKKVFRRYYTCPFFKSVVGKGCPISFEYKPYGCLAYNPHHENTILADQCSSEISILQQREDKFEIYETNAIEFLKEKLRIHWNKKPLPVALVELHKILV